MSYDADGSDSPPPFGTGDEQPDESMYQSTVPTNSSDVNLNDDDDDDEDPFGAPQPSARTKTPTNTTNTVDAYSAENQTSEDNTTASNANDDDDDPFGEKENKPTPSTPVTTTPVKEEKPLYPSVSQVSSIPSVTTSSFTTQPSTSSTNYTSTEPSTTSKSISKRLTSDAIEITVSDPTKIGDGMSSYMTYRISTKTNLSVFKKEEFSVNRRFSDFLGLHAKLVNKYLHMGIIVPMPPEKDSLGTAKVKISKDESSPSDFIDRRRALLERYLNRLSLHGKLVEDPDVREFLEMPGDLPKSKDTAALSGAGVMRALSSISNTVTKLTMKTAEQDKWFEEQHTIVVDLQTHLKHTYNQFNYVLNQRKEAEHSLKQFVVALNHLATTEEHTSLSAALTELANLHEKLEQINNEYASKEYSIVTELIKEYILLLNMVQLAFNERIKTHQQWLNAEDTLKKARERKTKLEQSPKNADKLPQAEADIRDGEAKVTKGKEDFESISVTIKDEMTAFEQTRAADFVEAIGTYLKALLEQQEKVLQLWEGYLPEANKITV